MSFDPRSLALIVFQKLHQELGRLEDDPADIDLRRWIEEAIDFIPSVTVAPGDRPHELILRPLAGGGAGEEDESKEPIVLNVRLTMDALRLLWREYRDTLAPDEAND